jgi:hypothetical protein
MTHRPSSASPHGATHAPAIGKTVALAAGLMLTPLAQAQSPSHVARWVSFDGRAATVELGQGYNSLSGSFYKSPFEPMPGTRQTGSGVEYSLSVSESKADLYREMRVDARASIRGLGWSASGRLETVNKLTFTELTSVISGRVKVDLGTTTVGLSQLTLSDEARRILAQQGAKGFYAAYGDQFVAGIRTGAELLGGAAKVHQSRSEKKDFSARLRTSSFATSSRFDTKKVEAFDKELANLSLSCWSQGASDYRLPSNGQELVTALKEFPELVHSKPQHAMVTDVNTVDYCAVLAELDALSKATFRAGEDLDRIANLGIRADCQIATMTSILEAPSLLGDGIRSDLRSGVESIRTWHRSADRLALEICAKPWDQHAVPDLPRLKPSLASVLNVRLKRIELRLEPFQPPHVKGDKEVNTGNFPTDVCIASKVVLEGHRVGLELGYKIVGGGGMVGPFTPSPETVYDGTKLVVLLEAEPGYVVRGVYSRDMTMFMPLGNANGSGIPTLGTARQGTLQGVFTQRYAGRRLHHAIPMLPSEMPAMLATHWKELSFSVDSPRSNDSEAVKLDGIVELVVLLEDVLN